MRMDVIKLFILCAIAFAFVGCARLENVTIDKTSSGKQVEYVLTKNSSASDTVVFENGLGGSMEGWAKVLPEVSKSATVFAYNRPGYGDSAAVESARDGEHIASELRELLAEKGLKPPYILVGHSLGGLYLQYFARRYPNEVKALILVDSTHPKQMEGKGAPENWSWFVRLLVTAWLNDSQKEELRLVSKSGKEVLSLPTIAGKQVIVLSASKPLDEKSELADYSNELRKDITRLYPDSKQIWVDSGHNIPLEKPEIVIDSIRKHIQ